MWYVMAGKQVNYCSVSWKHRHDHNTAFCLPSLQTEKKIALCRYNFFLERGGGGGGGGGEDGAGEWEYRVQ